MVYPALKREADVDRFGVQTPESYLYTSRSKCYNVDTIDDHADFSDTLRAMDTIGLSQDEKDDIFRTLAAVLWLGNVQFVENNEGNAAIGDESVPTYVAYLMNVDAAAVIKVAILLFVSNPGFDISHHRSTKRWSTRFSLPGPIEYCPSYCCA